MRRALLAALLLAGASRAEEGPSFMDQTWLAYWGAGLAAGAYPEAAQKALGEGRLAGAGVDSWGFYWPLKDRRTALGFVAHGSGEFRLNGLVPTSLVQAIYAFSALRSLEGELGDGWFLRGELGPALSITGSGPYGPANTYVESRDYGFGAGLGLGCLFGSKPGYRIPLTLMYSPKLFKDGAFHSLSLLVGCLW